MNAIPWYQSPVMVSAVVAIISQLLVLVGKQDLVPIDVITAKVEAFFQIVALGATLWAAWKRKSSPIQPLTVTKAGAEKRQGGFARAGMLGLLLAVSAPLVLSACVQTTRAYRNADTPSDYALVLLEQYDAVLVEANRLKASGRLSTETLNAIRAADLKAQPFVDTIRPLQQAYEASRSSADAAALQSAVNNAITAVADLIRAVKAAGGS